MKNYILKSFLLLFLICLASSLKAQGTQYLTMSEAVLYQNAESKQSLKPQTLPLLYWLPGGSKYSYVQYGTPLKLFIVDAESGRIDSSISLDVFNMAAEKYKAGMKFKAFPYFEWIDNDNLKIYKDNEYLNFNLAAQAFRLITTISEKSEHVEYYLKSNYFAYIENDNLFVKANEKVHQLTTDGGNGIVYGQTVHRNEFGINKGLYWSPDGNKLAFYRMDESMVTDYYIYNNDSMPATVRKIKYPIAGAKSHHVTVGIFDLETQKITYLETGEPKEQYLTNITWTPSSEAVIVAIVNRGQNQCFVNKYNAESGVLEKILFEERDEKYVEPQHGIQFLKNETNKFIWQSERDGFNHLYLYNDNGKMIRQLTKGSWVVTDLLGIDARGEYAYFEGTKESPIERHIYRVNIDNGEIKKLSSEAGTHKAKFNPQFTQFIDEFNSLTTPYKASLKDAKGENIRLVSNAQNPLVDYKLGETSIFPIFNEGNVLYCRMITPPDFDKSKQYPSIVYVYGGPHVQLVRNTWLGGSDLWMQLMAQKGYIVFSVDNRGSANRGHAFESAVHRQLGTLEMSDQLAGVNYLKNLPYINPNSIGVFGWSFGGFMTTTLMTRAPGTFKVGVAGGPVINWNLYEIMYTERYMDTPDENPEGYKKNNLLNYVNSLQDKLLMIHGCDDDVVLWQHSLLYCKRAVDVKNTYLDYFVYPGHPHNVRGPDRVHLMQKITEYLMENLSY